MFFHIDLFHTQPTAMWMHRRRSSRSLGSNPLASPSDVPVLALRARSRVVAARRPARLLSFVALSALWRRRSSVSDGPRAA